MKSAYFSLKGSIVQMLLCQKYMQNHTLSTTTVSPPPLPRLKKKEQKVALFLLCNVLITVSNKVAFECYLIRLKGLNRLFYSFIDMLSS